MTAKRGAAEAAPKKTASRKPPPAKARAKPKPKKPAKVKETRFAPLAPLIEAPAKAKPKPKPKDEPAPEFLDEMEQDAKAKVTKAPDPEAMNKITELSEELAKLDSYIERGEEAIKKAKARRLEIQTRDLVDLMDKAGQDHVGLPNDNVDIVVSTAYHASLPALPPPHKEDYQERFERRQRGLSWLREEGHDGLIKTEVIIEFPRGGVARAAQVAEEMAQRAEEHARHHDGERPYAVEVKEAVNHNSLSKLVKDLSEQGRTDLPLADLGAHVIRVAEIIPRSERKTTTKKLK